MVAISVHLPALQLPAVGYISAMQGIKKLFLLAVVLAVFGGGAWLGFKAKYMLGGGLHFGSTATVVQQVQALSDLVTVKYVLEKVEVLEDAKWYGESKVLFLAHGVVKAGVDLKSLEPGDVTISGKTITLHLPPAQIMDAYLDDQNSQVIDHTTGLLRSFDKNLEQTARQNAVEDISRAARQGGILNDAQKQAEVELRTFLHQAGFEHVEFR